jgi:hypothetical protein
LIQSKQITGIGAGTLVFEPSGTVTGNNVFASWLALYAASLPGTVVEVNSNFATANVPTGNYPNIEVLQGNFSQNTQTSLNLLDGVVLPGLAQIQNALLVNVHGTTVCPIVRAGASILSLLNGGGIQRLGSQPAIRLVPDNALGGGPFLIAINSGAIGSGAQDVEINPASAAAGFVALLVTDSSVKSNTFYGAGPFAADAEAIILFSDSGSTQQADNPLTQPGLGAGQFTVETRASLQALQFGALSSATNTVGPLSGILPFGSNPTTLPLADATSAPGGQVAWPGLLTEWMLSLTGNGLGANPTTFTLFKNGVAVPGAVLNADVGVSGFTGFLTIRFSEGVWYDESDIFSIQFLTTNPVPTAFTGILSLIA